MIATRDIGAAAADILLKLDFVGKQSRELLGLVMSLTRKLPRS